MQEMQPKVARFVVSKEFVQGANPKQAISFKSTAPCCDPDNGGGDGVEESCASPCMPNGLSIPVLGLNSAPQNPAQNPKTQSCKP